MEVLSTQSAEESTLIESMPSMDRKEEAIERLTGIKGEIPSLFFSQYNSAKDFSSEDENHLDGDLALHFSESSDSDGSFDSDKRTKLRRNRRKPLLPQKTVQSEISQTGSVGTSSECSQDAAESAMLNFADTLIDSAADGDFLDFADGDDLLQDIDEENIFKGLQEETGNGAFIFFLKNNK